MIRRILALCALALTPLPASAQGQVALGGLSADPSAPVEVTGQTFTVDQTARTAVFEGGVVIGQGEMRISAERVEAVFGADSSEIQSLVATGGVTFVTATDAAEAARAEYDIAAGALILTGDVLLQQGGIALAGDRMTINLRDGAARIEGNVRTVFGTAQ